MSRCVPIGKVTARQSSADHVSPACFTCLLPIWSDSNQYVKPTAVIKRNISLSLSSIGLLASQTINPQQRDESLWNTIQYNTLQCNTMQCNAIQHNSCSANMRGKYFKLSRLTDLIAVVLSSFSRNLQPAGTVHHPLAVITSPDKTLPRDLPVILAWQPRVPWTGHRQQPSPILSLLVMTTENCELCDWWIIVSRWQLSKVWKID